jgi:uncharacterized protein YecE (DUF72 family)
VTADFAYLRFHGPERRYGSDHSEDALGEWAKRIRGWRSEGRDVYAYFKNDCGGLCPEERAPPPRARVGVTVAQ